MNGTLRGAESRSAGFDRVMVRGSGSDDGRAKGGCKGGVATVVDIIGCVSVLRRHLGDDFLGVVHFLIHLNDSSSALRQVMFSL